MKKYHGHWLKRARLERELTQSDIAGDRFTKQYVSMVEKGYVKLSNNAIKYIRRKLKLPKDYFDTGLYNDEKERLDELIIKIDSLSDSYNYSKAESKTLEALKISKEAKNDDYINLFSLKLARILIETKKLNKAETILSKTDKYFEEEKDFYNLAYSYYWTGVLYMVSEKYTDAVYMYNSSIEINSKLKRKEDLSLKARATAKIAQIYRETENYKGAKEKYEEAAKLAEQSKVDYIIAMTYWEYSRLLQREGEYEKAISYYNKAATIYKILKYERQYLKINNNLANLYYYLNDYDNTIDLANKTIKISEDKGYDTELAYALLFRSKAKREKDLLNEAESDIKRSISMLKKIDDKRELGVSYMTQGLIYEKKKEYDNAILSFNKAINIFKELDKPVFINSAYSEIIRFYKDIGKSDKALEYTEYWINYAKRIKF